MVYSLIQDGTAADEERRNRAMAERLHVQHVPDDRVNDQALPNPWAPPPPPTVSPASGSARGLFGTSPFGGAGMFGMPPGMGFPMAGPGQSSATSSSATSPLNSMMQQLAQNPDTIMQVCRVRMILRRRVTSDMVTRHAHRHPLCSYLDDGSEPAHVSDAWFTWCARSYASDDGKPHVWADDGMPRSWFMMDGQTMPSL